MVPTVVTGASYGWSAARHRQDTVWPLDASGATDFRAADCEIRAAERLEDDGVHRPRNIVDPRKCPHCSRRIRFIRHDRRILTSHTRFPSPANSLDGDSRSLTSTFVPKRTQGRSCARVEEAPTVRANSHTLRAGERSAVRGNRCDAALTAHWRIGPEVGTVRVTYLEMATRMPASFITRTSVCSSAHLEADRTG